MKYLYLFGGIAIVSAIGAFLLGRVTRVWLVFWLGLIGSILAVIGFFLNKSDSVDDTLVEQLATFIPPLISFACVIGWWVGYALLRLFARYRSDKPN